MLLEPGTEQGKRPERAAAAEAQVVSKGRTMPWSSQEAGNEDKLALIPSVESFVMCRLPGPDLSHLVLLQLSCPRFPESSMGRGQHSTGGAWGELPIPAASPSRASLPRGLQGAEKAETAAHKNSFFSRLHLQPSPLKGTDGRALLSMGQLSETRRSSRSGKCWAGVTLCQVLKWRNAAHFQQDINIIK